jgi:AcrR family transcriptional regulator
VSVQSIYKAFGNKPALLKTVFDVAIAGDDEPVPMLQRAALSRVRAEPDPRRKLSLYGEFVAEVSPRHVPIQLLVRAAAATDAEAARVWDQLRVERMTGMTMFARALHQEGSSAPTSRSSRPATCSGPATPPRSTSCWWSSAGGHPSGTGAGSPTR